MKVYTDFDGTLSRGYISMDFMDFLFHERLYHKDSYKRQQQALKDYKGGRIDYDSWCEQWGMSWAEGMKGQKVKDIEEASKQFYHGFKRNIYPSSYEIIRFLKKNFETSCISVGASEVISLAARDLGIKSAFATVLETDSRYTGRLMTDLHMAGGKKRFLQKEKKSFIGLGDSRGDIEFLEQAKIPIVMNPDKIMREYAEFRNWLILDSTTPADRLIAQIYSRLQVSNQ